MGGSEGGAAVPRLLGACLRGCEDGWLGRGTSQIDETACPPALPAPRRPCTCSGSSPRGRASLRRARAAPPSTSRCPRVRRCRGCTGPAIAPAGLRVVANASTLNPCLVPRRRFLLRAEGLRRGHVHALRAARGGPPHLHHASQVSAPPARRPALPPVAGDLLYTPQQHHHPIPLHFS